MAGRAGGSGGEGGDSPTDLPLRRQQHYPPNVPLSRSSGHSRGSASASISGITHGMTPGRRESGLVLPTWQADSEVSKCPVCNTDFSFFHRKHHCRKCGRVVCGACSSHRITIPTQYVVQPPGALGSEAQTTASQGQSAPGGGETVRVCNPCVPDPWTPTTAQDVPDEPDRRRSIGVLPPPPPPRYPSTVARSRAQTFQSGPTNLSRNANPYNRGPPPPFPSVGVPSQRWSPSTDSINALIREPHHSSAVPSPVRPPQRYTQRTAHDNVAFPEPPRYQPSPPAGPPPQRPKRKVREEDECPVCGRELVPYELVRQTHIEHCIAQRLGEAPSPSSTTFTSSTPLGISTASYRPRGMALYYATEKDCTAEDGEAQECVICLEDFQPGDEMGRMECWCKFHRTCIRQWWDTKGTGACPTHQLHD